MPTPKSDQELIDELAEAAFQAGVYNGKVQGRLARMRRDDARQALLDRFAALHKQIADLESRTP